MMINTHLNPLIITKPQQLTTHWAQSVVNHQANPELKSTKIHHLEIVSIDVGTTTRVRLKIDHDGPTTLPNVGL